MDGPLALPFGHPDLALARPCGPGPDPAGALREALAPRGASGTSNTLRGGHAGRGVPDGFIVTAAACQRLFRRQGLQEEIGRRVQRRAASGRTICWTFSPSVVRLILAAEVLDEVGDALMDALDRPAGAGGRSARAQERDMRLLLRGRVWPQGSTGAGENTDDDAGGMTLWGRPFPCSKDIPVPGRSPPAKPTGSRCCTPCAPPWPLKYSPQAIAYRRNRGLRDAGTCVCVGCFAVEARPWPGHRLYRRNPLHARDTSVHVYAARGLSEAVEDGAHDVDAHHVCRAGGSVRLRSIADAVSGPVLHDVLRPAPWPNWPWPWRNAAACPRKSTGCWNRMVLSRCCMPPAPARAARPSAGKLRRIGGRRRRPDRMPALGPAGRRDYRRTGRGGRAGAYRARTDDACSFPDGAVLVVARDLADWGMLLDRASAVVAERGASPASWPPWRATGKPAVFGLFRRAARWIFWNRGQWSPCMATWAWCIRAA